MITYNCLHRTVDGTPARYCPFSTGVKFRTGRPGDALEVQSGRANSFFFFFSDLA